MSDTNAKIAARLGLKPGFTNAQFTVAAEKTAAVYRAKAEFKAKLAESAAATQAAKAELSAARTVAAMATQLAATARTVEGPKLLSREEAQDVSMFGAHSRITRKRQEATEDHFGMTLAAALRDGLL